MTDRRLVYLASQSQRRRQLLAHLGVAFEPLDTEVEERQLPDERPQEMAIRLAVDKVRAGLAVMAERRRAGVPVVAESVVLAADTLVNLDGEPLGKPGSEREAKAMLEALCGRSHSILTAVAVAPVVADPAAQQEVGVELAATEVRMRRASPAWISYCASHPEARRSAGAYAVQGAAAALVESINGCFYTIVGLPLAATSRLLNRYGLDFRPELAAVDGVFGAPSP